MSELSKLYSKVTGLTYDIDKVIAKATTPEAKEKLMNKIAWSIKKGTAWTAGANETYDKLLKTLDSDGNGKLEGADLKGSDIDVIVAEVETTTTSTTSTTTTTVAPTETTEDESSDEE